MMRRLALAVFIFGAPALGRAAEPPERLLSAGMQIYLRWDGIDAHRMAYESTALGKIVQGDMGKFVGSVFADLTDLANKQFVVPRLMSGISPDRLQKIQADAAAAPKLLDTLSHHGLIIGVEVRQVMPPQAQLTLILPKAGAKPQPFLSALRLGASLAQLDVKEAKILNRSVHRLDLGPAHAAWWVEGEDAIVVAGTDPAEVAVKRAVDSAGRLADKPLFQRVQGFKDFETGARGFVDVAGLVQVGRSFDKNVSKVIDELGVDGLKSIVIYSGFDGAAERGVLEIDLAATERKGVLRLLGGKPFRLGDLPPMPPDTISFSAARFDFQRAYDVAAEAGEAVLRVAAPQQVPLVRAYLKQTDTAVGVNLRDELLGSLGDLFVSYVSPAEGPINLGQTVLLKVKDAKKLQEAIENAIRGIAGLTGGNITINKRAYRGVQLYEVQIKQPGVFFLPTYAIHKDWLAVSLYPQAVKGFILREQGEMAGWKPDPRTRATLEQMPAEVTTITVSDPRPTVTQLLSITPVVAAGLKSVFPDTKFDVTAVPNAQEVTRHLFPNVSVVTNDGKKIRMETRASLAMPLDLTGLDTYAIALGFLIPILVGVQ